MEEGEMKTLYKRKLGIAGNAAIAGIATRSSTKYHSNNFNSQIKISKK